MSNYPSYSFPQPQQQPSLIFPPTYIAQPIPFNYPCPTTPSSSSGSSSSSGVNVNPRIPTIPPLEVKCDENPLAPILHKHDDYLYVVTMISNPVRFQRRLELFNNFCKYMRSNPRVKLYAAELQFGDRVYETDAQLKLRTRCEMWHKENVLNLLIERLPETAKYIAWIDADVEFKNPNWAEETIHELQHYDIVQLFSQAIDLGPKYNELINVHTGFMYEYFKHGKTLPPVKTFQKKKKTGMMDYYGNVSSDTTVVVGGRYVGHPGYAFAIRKSALKNLGGLFDVSIIGSGDHIMCMAWVGEVERAIHHKASENFKMKAKIYQDRAETYIQRKIGYVPGILFHYWHGPKANRKYTDRWSILVDNHYEPDEDIKRDHQGLYLIDINKANRKANIKLRDDLMTYFRIRNEDQNTE